MTDKISSRTRANKGGLSWIDTNTHTPIHPYTHTLGSNSHLYPMAPRRQSSRIRKSPSSSIANTLSSPIPLSPSKRTFSETLSGSLSAIKNGTDEEVTLDSIKVELTWEDIDMVRFCPSLSLKTQEGNVFGIITTVYSKE